MASANPSFSCLGNLNQTERAICGSALLSDLDRQMANFYFALRDQAGGARRDALAAEQRLWLAWRNACGAEGQCIRRRYEQRIIDLAPPDELPLARQPGRQITPPADPGASGDPNQIVARRVTSTRVEVEFADGTVHWQSVGGGSMGTVFPDGTESAMYFAQAPAPVFPTLPGDYSSWGEGVESSLLSILDRLLSPTDRATYRNLAASKAFSVRVYDHIRVIDFLTGQ